MKTWQKGFLATLTVITFGVISLGLYLVYITNTSYQKPIPTNVKLSNPTQRPTNTPLPPCDKPTVSAWVDRLLARQNESNNDMDIAILMQSPNPDDYILLANRAKVRYDGQRLEQNLECLSELQALMVDVFYYNWQGYVAMTRGDWDKGASYIQIMADKLENAEAAINAAIELTK